jgi:hypothetical protein
MHQPWWRSRKVWGTLLAASIRLWGHKIGLDPEAASDAALLLLGGVGVEGVIDAVSAFGAAWKRTP